MDSNAGSFDSSSETVNEIENHPDCRYMTPNAVVWRLPKGMKNDLVSNYPRSYVKNKSFPVDDAQMPLSTKPFPSKEMVTRQSSKSIQSVMIHTPEGSNNTTPSSCQCATIVIEKNNIGTL